MNRLLVLFVAMLAAGCPRGTGQTTTTTPNPLDDLRARAAAAPRDGALWTQLARAELLEDGGDASQARAALDRALELAPHETTHYLSALEHEMHGRPDAALDAFVAAADAARTSQDEFAAIVAEISLDGIRQLHGVTRRYDEVVNPLLRRILEEPGSLGYVAVEAAAGLLRSSGRRRAQEDVADEATAAMACLTEWRAAGPFGPWAMLGFDTPPVAEGEGSLEARYDLGGEAGEQDTWEPNHHDCRIEVSAPEHRGPGTTVLEAFVEVADAGTHLLVVDSGASLRVRIDGEEVGRVDRRDALHASYTYVPLELSAGRHELELSLTTRANSYGLGVSLDRAGRLGEGYDPLRGVAIPAGTERLHHLLRTKALLGRGHPLAAREAFRPVENARSAALLLALNDLLDHVPFQPENQVSDRQRQVFQQIGELAPGAVLAQLAKIASERGEQERYEALRAVAERFPDLSYVQMFLASTLRQRGELPEAEAILRRIVERMPGQCGPVRALQHLVRGSGRVAEANAMVETLMACDASSTERLNLHLRRRQWDEARAEITRLDAFLSDEQIRGHRLRLAVATGDTETEQTLRAEIETESPDSRDSTLARVDRLLASGQRAQAIALLDQAAERDPSRMSGLRDVRRDLTGRDELEPFRLDGAEMITRYEAEHAEEHAEAGQVLVLDYMVVRYFRDGSSRQLIHQIMKIQDEQSLERLGQISLGGDILTLRSIKPDGRRLEPEAIGGLDSIPMTDLEIGDYVEYEYVRSAGPTMTGGISNSSWAFDSYTQPFAFSQLIALLPEGMDLRVEVQGGAPAAEETRAGDLRQLTWTMRDVPARTQEPGSVPLPPFRPTLSYGNWGWAEHFMALREGLRDKDPEDPAAGRLVARVLGDLRDAAPEAKIARLHRWVLEEIDPAGGWGGYAPAMLHARRGDRTRVLRYLLERAGLPTDLLLSRTIGSPEPNAIAEPELYSTAVLRVRPEGQQPIFVFAELKGAAPTLLPPAVRGQEAVALVTPTEGDAVMVTLPDSGPATDLHDVRVEVQLRRSGDAEVHVVESYGGALGATWRERLESVPPAELPRLMREAYVPRVLAGAEVGELEVRGTEEWGSPLVIEYTARVPGYARARGNALLLPPMLAANLAGSYAPMPSRTTTQIVPASARRVVTVVRQAGASAGEPPVVVDAGGLHYERRARAEGADLVVERSIRIPMGVVGAADYPAFAQIVRRITAAENAEIVIGGR